MKLISKKQYLIEKILNKSKPYYGRDNIELNTILYEHHYFESTGRTWEQFVKNLSIIKLTELLKDLNKLQ